MKIIFFIAIALGFYGTAAAEPIKVASLHPLIGHLVKKIGGEQLEVIDLIGPEGDPHRFQPNPQDLLAAKDAKIYFLSGMGLEPYREDLGNVLPAGAKIVEVGNSLPALYGACDNEGHHHGEHHHELDPHWWHSVDHFKRAASVVAQELGAITPARKAVFDQNLQSYRKELEELDRWIRKELFKVPKASRLLVTSHSAFQYFCEAYGFKSLAVQGINREQMPDALALAKLIKQMKEQKVQAIFSEEESNPKTLQSLTSETGIKNGGTLIADGRGVDDYGAMMRSNVGTIVKALSGIISE